MNSQTQKIIPSLWFDRNCEEAMNFYVSTFSGISGDNKDSGIISIVRYEEGMQAPGTDQMLGKVLNGIFELEGYRFIALDGGPIFKFNPSISFTINFDPSVIKNARENLDILWNKLSTGGKVMMELQKYPFSERYGWVEDKYGVSWQLILSNPAGDPRPFITPTLMFTGEYSGKAEEAVGFYLTVFRNSKSGILQRYPEGMDPDKSGTVMYSDFMIEKQWFAAMDSARMHGISFNEAVSFTVNCTDQEEIDVLWKKLSHSPDSEQCGWLKDKFGVSWQIVPERMGELLSDPDRERTHRVINTLLRMKKIVISELEEAFVEP